MNPRSQVCNIAVDCWGSQNKDCNMLKVYTGNPFQTPNSLQNRRSVKAQDAKATHFLGCCHSQSKVVFVARLVHMTSKFGCKGPDVLLPTKGRKRRSGLRVSRGFGDHGKDNGNYYNGLYRDYRVYIGVRCSP